MKLRLRQKQKGELFSLGDSGVVISDWDNTLATSRAILACSSLLTLVATLPRTRRKDRVCAKKVLVYLCRLVHIIYLSVLYCIVLYYIVLYCSNECVLQSTESMRGSQTNKCLLLECFSFHSTRVSIELHGCLLSRIRSILLKASYLLLIRCYAP